MAINQCDGCRSGIPVVNGVHRMGKEGGYSDLMACTKDRYIQDRFILIDEKQAGEVGRGYTQAEAEVLKAAWHDWWGYPLTIVPMQTQEA